MNKVGFISLGCPKNLVDSEVRMGQLKQHGFQITSDAEEADTVVVNTCGFIDSAKKESIEAILEAARLKTDGKAKRLIVAGCLVERYRDELKAELPEVDAFIGTSQINDILSVCDPNTKTRSLPVVPLGNQSATYLYDESTPRVLATPSHYAFIKIAEGCDRPCAFCFIPQMRGHFRSRRFGSIVAEAHQLAEEGVKELILVAEDSSRYWEDLGKQDALAHLLRELPHTGGIERLRVMYTYPTHTSDAFPDVLPEDPKNAKKKHHAMIGQTVRILFEGESSESDLLWQGRMQTQAPDIDSCVLINDAPDGVLPESGKFVNVLIEEAYEYDLLGSVV